MASFLKGHKHFSILFFAAVFSVSFLYSLAPDTAFAFGEQYTWKDSNIITAKGGKYGGGAISLAASKEYKPGKDNIPTFSSGIGDGAIFRDPDNGCGLDLTLAFSGKDASKATLTVVLVDPFSCKSGTNPKTVTSNYDKTILLKNVGNADQQPEKISITVISRVEEGVDYPGSSDNISIRVTGTTGIKAQKKVDSTKKYESEDKKYTGYKVSFGGLAAGVKYDACSQALGICSGGGGFKDLYTENQSEITITKNLTDEDSAESSCAIDQIGWIVCPLMNFMAKINDGAFTFLQTFLTIKPALITDDATRNAWAAFRDIANVAFVIAFMFIVYSQITSVGVSNYGIKKLLPRIVVAAILVNVSYYICALMVDVSNIVGSSAYTLLRDMVDVGSGGTADNAWSEIVGKILVGAAIGAGVILLVIALITAPAVLLAFAVIILILIARQAFVILLIVAAPLAFVAYLLPNTESWFKKWWKAFVAVLMVYPIIAVVFGASTIASRILMNVADDGGAGGDDEQLLKIIALAVLAIPLFAVPLLLKGSLSAAGSIGTRIASLSDRSNRLAGKQAKSRAGAVKKDLGNRFGIAAQDPENKLGRKLGGYSRWKNRRDMGRQDRETAANRSRDLGYATSMIEKDADGELTDKAIKLQQAAAGGVGVANEKGKVRARALATQRTFKQFDDDISAFQTTQTSDRQSDLMRKQKDTSLSVEERAAAAGTIASRSYRKGHNESLAAMHQEMGEADSAYLAAQEAVGATTEGTAARSTAEKTLGEARSRVGEVEAIQKQFKGQWKDKSFGMSDTAIGELGEGIYGRANVQHNDDGTEKIGADGKAKRVTVNDIYTDTRMRSETKLNEQTLVTMNPDDLNIIYDAAIADPSLADALNDEQMQEVVTRIVSARGNKETSKFIKKEASDKFDRILVEAGKRKGVTVPAQAAAPTQLSVPHDEPQAQAAGMPAASPTASTPAPSMPAQQTQSTQETIVSTQSAPESPRTGLADRLDAARKASYTQSAAEMLPMSDLDVIKIRNEQGSSVAGEAARDELIRRGIINPQERNLP